jgi:hypothetical protein
MGDPTAVYYAACELYNLVIRLFERGFAYR